MNKTNYEKLYDRNFENNNKRKHSHKTVGFSFHPQEAEKIKEMLYKVCYVINQQQKEKEQAIIDKAKKEGVAVTLGKKNRISQSTLLSNMVEEAYKQLKIDVNLERIKMGLPVADSEQLRHIEEGDYSILSQYITEEDDDK